MSIKQASWVHGTSAQIENPSALKHVTRYAFYTQLVGRKGAGTWVHFPIPTPVITDDIRLRLESAMVRFRCHSNATCIAHFHVCDGENRFLVHDHVNLVHTDWNTPFHREVVRPEHALLWGIGVTIFVEFSGNTDDENTIDLAAAGCDFIV